jgi:hypothetical protein
MLYILSGMYVCIHACMYNIVSVKSALTMKNQYATIEPIRGLATTYLLPFYSRPWRFIRKLVVANLFAGPQKAYKEVDSCQFFYY